MAKDMVVTKDNSMATLQSIAANLPVRADDEDLDSRMVAEILSSSSLEEATKDRKLPSLGDRPGAKFTVTDLARVDGGQNSELGFYLMVGVKYDDGVELAAATGAPKVVAVLLWAYAHGELEGTEWMLVVTPSTKVAGREIHRLVTADHF